MRASASPDVAGPRPRLATRLASVLPLPRASDWSAADGWLPAGLLLAATGTAALAWLAWRNAAPATAPAPVPLLAAAALLTLVGLAGGGALALRPGGQAPVWRCLTLGAVALGVLLAGPGGLHVRFGFPCFVSAALLALGMRAAETLAASLAVPLHARARLNPLAGPTPPPAPGSRPPPPSEADATSGQSPVWTAWRLVAELWVLAAATAAAVGLPAGPAWRLAAAALAGGGALLVVGAALVTLQASWTARGFAFDRGQAPAFWGLGLACAGTLTLLALVLPVPPAPLSARVLSDALHGLGQARLPFRHAAATRAGAGGAKLAPGAELLIVPAAVLVWLAREFWGYLGLWFLDPLALPLILPLAAAAGFFLFRALRRPPFRASCRRLALAVVASLAFWRRLRLPRRMRRLLTAMGLLAPAAARLEEARDGAPTPVERLWGLVDPRAAVRRTYRRFLHAMAAAGSARGAGQSPRAFERAVRARELAGPGVAELTAAYELARYSGRVAERTWAERARRGWAAVTGRATNPGRRVRPVAARRGARR